MKRTEFTHDILKPRFRVKETTYTGAYEERQHDLLIPGTFEDLLEAYASLKHCKDSGQRAQYELVVLFPGDVGYGT